MGLLRLLLAISVVLAHAGKIHGFRPLESAEAVQTFYMISGFYMGMILTEKYTGAGSYRLFLYNRLLRIYPTYWAVLIISAVIWWLAGSAVHEINPLSILQAGFGGSVLVLLIGSNLLLLGQDLVMFSGATKSGRWRFTPDFQQDRRPLWHYLLVPQAWSLSIELMFYAVAPFMVAWRTRTLLAIMLLCAILRLTIYLGLHLHRDPWTYRFAPAELLLFLAGVLAYRTYRRLDRRGVNSAVCVTVTIALIVICLFYQQIPVRHIAKQWAFYCFAWAALPFVFLASRSNSLDRQIGDLSYPVYLSHYLFVFFLPPFLQRLRPQMNESTAILVVTLLASIILNFLVIGPVERVRRRVASRLSRKQPIGVLS
jgi:peptidoglycan/LPS O-acetylase OafA/YrhL